MDTSAPALTRGGAVVGLALLGLGVGCLLIAGQELLVWKEALTARPNTLRIWWMSAAGLPAGAMLGALALVVLAGSRFDVVGRVSIRVALALALSLPLAPLAARAVMSVKLDEIGYVRCTPPNTASRPLTAWWCRSAQDAPISRAPVSPPRR